MKPDGPRDPIAGPDAGPESPFPIKLGGKVIKGFGRGSKEVCLKSCSLGISSFFEFCIMFVLWSLLYSTPFSISLRAKNFHNFNDKLSLDHD